MKKIVNLYKTNKDVRQLTYVGIAYVFVWLFLWYLSQKFILVLLFLVCWPFIWLVWKFIKFNLECIAYTLRQIFK